MNNKLPSSTHNNGVPTRFTFSKNERLCSQKAIEALFCNNKGIFYFPFRVVYSVVEAADNAPMRIAISVPKKAFKRAVKRNIIKRRIREAYRKHKSDFYAKLPQNCTINVMLIYVSPNIAEYAEIESRLVATLNRLAKSIENDSNPAPNTAN